MPQEATSPWRHHRGARRAADRCARPGRRLGHGQPDGTHEFGCLPGPEPPRRHRLGPAPDPKLYATYAGAMGKPSGPALGTETGPADKIKDKLS
jgi:hypothetical protein